MVKACSFAFFLAALAGAQALPPIAIGANVQTFGMIGIAEGQTARLNVLNPGVQAPAATAALCSGLLTFWDDQGQSLKTLSVTVIPGHSMALDLDADVDLKLLTNQRKQIRATIQIPAILPPTAMGMSTCTLIPTLEIFDRVTGKTQVVIEQTRYVAGGIVPLSAR
jgi:hypothetical protein